MVLPGHVATAAAYPYGQTHQELRVLFARSSYQADKQIWIAARNAWAKNESLPNLLLIIP